MQTEAGVMAIPKATISPTAQCWFQELRMITFPYFIYELFMQCYLDSRVTVFRNLFSVCMANCEISYQKKWYRSAVSVLLCHI